MRYNPDTPYSRGGISARVTPGMPAPGMPASSVIGPSIPFHRPMPGGQGPVTAASVSAVATQPFPGSHIGFSSGTAAPHLEQATYTLPVTYHFLADPATGKIAWWVWGIVAVILLYVVKKYII